MTIDDIKTPIICIAKDKKIEIMARGEFELRNLEKGYHLVALERPDHDPDTTKVTVVQVMITQQRSSYMLFKAQTPITQARLMILRKDMTIR